MTGAGASAAPVGRAATYVRPHLANAAIDEWYAANGVSPPDAASKAAPADAQVLKIGRPVVRVKLSHQAPASEPAAGTAAAANTQVPRGRVSVARFIGCFRL